MFPEDHPNKRKIPSYSYSSEIRERSASGIETLKIRESIVESHATFDPIKDERNIIPQRFFSSSEEKLFDTRHQIHIPEINKNSTVFKIKKKNFWILLLLFFILIIGAASYLLLSSEDVKNEEFDQNESPTFSPTLDPNLFLACEGAAAEEIRLLINSSADISSERDLELNELNLPCIPTDPFKFLKEQIDFIVTQLVFSNCNISVIAKSAFDNFPSNTTEAIRFEDTNGLVFFGDQNLPSLRSILAFDADVFQLPNKVGGKIDNFGLSRVTLNDYSFIPHFFKDAEFGFFALQDVGFTDQRLVQFRDALHLFAEETGNAPFVMQKSEIGTNSFSLTNEPKVKIFPSGLLNAEMLQGSGTFLTISNFLELVDFEDGVFEGQFSYVGNFAVTDCPKFTSLPNAFKELRNLEGLGFQRTNLSFIEPGTPIQPDCEGLQQFKILYGIRETTNLAGLECE
eukprot:snap_masked-scaffold_22-processed-gene-2.9-mRNA-1 protein AED:0.08 eAED:1.00 QI:0/0/0/1/1/1/2/0/455